STSCCWTTRHLLAVCILLLDYKTPPCCLHPASGLQDTSLLSASCCWTTRYLPAAYILLVDYQSPPCCLHPAAGLQDTSLLSAFCRWTTGHLPADYQIQPSAPDFQGSRVGGIREAVPCIPGSTYQVHDTHAVERGYGSSAVNA
ncbi:hypothetical protein AB205_0011930, partial [Aquarana catesbeiana]